MAGPQHATANMDRLFRRWADEAASSGGMTEAHRLVEVTGFGSDPGHLRMLTHVPPGLPPSAPLVVVLHGCSQTASEYDRGSGWSELAARHGFALLFPEQRRTNNPGLCFNWFEPGDTTRGQGEALSIRQMVGHMIAAHGIDGRRVFVTGLSAGGAMASALLATYPELFAGGAIIAGLPFGAADNAQEAFDAMFHGRARPAREWGDLVRAASPHRGPWPRVSVWHGGADATVHPDNAGEVLRQWADVHGLPSRPDIEDRIDGYPHRAWRGPKGGEEGGIVLEAYSIPGMGHGTPIGHGPFAGADPCCGTAGRFMLDAGISSTWRIAESWGLTARPAAARRPSPVPATNRRAGRARKADPPPAIASILRAAGLTPDR